MKKGTIISIFAIIVLTAILGCMIKFMMIDDIFNKSSNQNIPEPPGGMGNNMNSSNSNIETKGATEITDTQTVSNVEYKSSSDSENALLIKDKGNLTITNGTINKTGDADDENSDFYGTNAGVLVTNGGTLKLSDSTVITNGKHANAVFAYGTGVANLSNVRISTTSDNSGGIMVTGGGTLTADECTVTTEGRSSAAVRSDRGGGNLTVNGGTYTSNGLGSPAIYSTANIVVSDAELNSTLSEGAIVEGNNSITLKNCVLTDNNTGLNGNSTTYKNIFLYQSMSGDADEGTASFTAEGGKIITKNGDTIYVTNTTAEINLKNVEFTNSSNGDFLRIEAGKWGKSGSNGGTVTLNAESQKIEGNIVVDDISTLTLNLNNGSTFIGAINKDNTAKEIKLVLAKTSSIKLTGDTYVTSLEAENQDYSNIDFNGYKLYVNGVAINK